MISTCFGIHGIISDTNSSLEELRFKVRELLRINCSNCCCVLYQQEEIGNYKNKIHQNALTAITLSTQALISDINTEKHCTKMASQFKKSVNNIEQEAF